MSEASKGDDVYSYCDVHDGFYIIQKYKNKKICEYNTTFAKMTGYENLSELSNTDLMQLIHPEDAGKFKTIKKSISSENPFGTLDLKLVKKDGNPIYVHCSIIYTSAEDGYERIIHTFSDITGSVNVQQQDDKLISMPPILFKFNIDDQFAYYFNNYFLDILGYTRDEIAELSLSYKDIIEEEDIEHFTHAIRSTARHNTTSSCDFRIKDKQGDVHWINCSLRKISIHSKSSYFIGVANDITEQKNTEYELEQSLGMLNSITKNVNCAILKLTVSEDKLVLSYSNDKLTEILGYTQKELLEHANDIGRFLIHPDDYEEFFNSVKEVSVQHGFECRALKKSGEIIWITAHSSVMEMSNKRFYLCVFQEISHIKSIEKELLVCNEQYAKLINCISEIAFKIDFKNDTLYNFDIFAKKFSMPSSLPNMPYYAINQGYIPEKYQQKYLDLYFNVKNGSPEESCIIKFTPPDLKPFWAKIRLIAICDDNGKAIKATGTIVDVSEQIKVENRLLQEEQYTTALTSNALMVCMINLNKSKIISCRIYNRSDLQESDCLFYDSKFIGRLTSYIHPDERQTVTEQISQQSLWNSFIQGNYSISFECRMICADKNYIWVHTMLNFIKDPSTDDIIVTMLARDIDTQKKHEIELIRKSEQDVTTGLCTKVPFKLQVDEFFEKNNFNGCLSALYLLDLDGFRRINNSFGYETGDKILQNVAENLKQISDSVILGRLYGDEFLIFVENLPSYDELNFTAKKICEICQNIKITGVDTSMLSGSVGVAFSPLHGTDFETLYKNADNALYNAKHFGKNRYAIYIGTDDHTQPGTQIDVLTKNITLDEFKKEASMAILKNNINYNLYNADIKRFRNFNHYYGYEVGDRILRNISDIIKAFLKPGEFFTRIFADNFLILTIAGNSDDQEKRMDSLIARIGDILELSSHKTYFAIGKLEITDSNRYIEFEHLIDCAVIAHRNSKSAEGTACITFNSNMEDEGLQKYEILSELKNALKSNQICTYVQPQFDLLRREYVSMEALVRWKHPEKGLLAPDKFIRICEENGFISNIDFCVLEQMCMYIRSRIDKKLRILPVAVNQSQLTIHETGYFKRITSLIEKYNIPPKYIELEVTESAYVNNLEMTIEILSKLKEYGFKISMDDFGTGYSSLNVLKDIPIDILKIDKGFLTQGLTEKKPKEIIKSITNMAHNINVRVVCEGVEFPQQIPFLEEIGCELAQGYLFGKPMPYDEVADFIEEYKLSAN